VSAGALVGATLAEMRDALAHGAVTAAERSGISCGIAGPTCTGCVMGNTGGAAFPADPGSSRVAVGSSSPTGRKERRPVVESRR